VRIERHQVGGPVVSAAREDFTNRIGGQVRSMSRAGRMSTYEWQSIAEEFHDYLGALSVGTPDLDTAEARGALKDASEAAAGAVAYAAYHPHCGFQVFLEYVNFGMSYDPGDDAPAESVTPAEWIDALCLSVLRDSAGRHGEAFHFAREKFTARAQGTPAGELATGLTAVVLDDTGDDEEYPPSAQASGRRSERRRPQGVPCGRSRGSGGKSTAASREAVDEDKHSRRHHQHMQPCGGGGGVSGSHGRIERGHHDVSFNAVPDGAAVVACVPAASDRTRGRPIGGVRRTHFGSQCSVAGLDSRPPLSCGGGGCPSGRSGGQVTAGAGAVRCRRPPRAGPAVPGRAAWSSPERKPRPTRGRRC
jgi:hypothetical protein